MQPTPAAPRSRPSNHAGPITATLLQQPARGILIAGALWLVPHLALGQTAQLPDDQLLGEFRHDSDGRTEYGHHNASSHDEPTASPLDGAITLDGAREPSVAKDVPKENYPYADCEFDKVEHCDLLAQQSMAASTKRMNWAAWVSVVLTAAGLLLIGRTMFYTRDAAAYAKRAADAADRAVDEAKAATRAAEQTIHVTQTLGEQQLRAYLSLPKTDIRNLGPGLIPKAFFKVRNDGVTPAFIKSNHIYFALCWFPKYQPLSYPPLGQQISSHILGSGQEYALFPSLGRPLTGDEFAALQQGRQAIFIYGNIVYSDIFKREQTFKFRMMCGGDLGIEGEAMAWCNEGNEQT